MNISIFGLGYVGAVTAGCLARRGHRVIGCDIQASKVDAINRGISPIREPGLDTLLADVHQQKLIAATQDVEKAVENSSISLVCVGTPSRSDGSVNTEYLESVSQHIAGAVARLKRQHTMVIRSTVLPDLLDSRILRPLAMQAASWLHICTNPEFLREGTALDDFDRPPMIIVGERQPGDGDELVRMYQGLDAPLYRMGIKEAALVKYASNMFHALKIVFGNEIGALCQAASIDSHEVMNVFCADNQLNISPRYLRPGFAYGGSCLPKDLRAILHFGRMKNVATPVLSAIELSNRSHIERCIQAILDTRARRIAMLGLSFKENTDDLRESPTIEIVERLIGKGLQVLIHDQDVAAGQLFGGNLTFVQQHLPHVATLMRDTPEEVIRSSDTIVISKPSHCYADIAQLVSRNQTVVDVVRFLKPAEFTACHYVGLSG